jgi:hypothetical protein
MVNTIFACLYVSARLDLNMWPNPNQHLPGRFVTANVHSSRQLDVYRSSALGYLCRYLKGMSVNTNLVVPDRV